MISSHQNIEKVAILFLIAFLLFSGVSIVAFPSSSPQERGYNVTVTPLPPRFHTDTPQKATKSWPMGIADVGRDENGTYSYHTLSVLGNATIFNVATIPRIASFTLQLNSVVVFTHSNVSYSYWVQDVAIINASAREITFMDNVWNFSNPGLSMSNTSVVGNGGVSKYNFNQSYYGFAGPSYPVAFPISLSLKMTAYDDHIQVYFSVNSTYSMLDNISFFTHSPLVFFVSSGNAPSGNLYDLEFVMGGPGSGAIAVFSNLSARMSLFYFNGYNYQNVPSAVNYGENTAETVTNVSSTFSHDENGSIYADIGMGNDSTGYLYQRSQLSTMNVTTSLPGVLFVNNFQISMMEHAVLYLYPGSYNITFINSSRVIYSATLSFAASKIVDISVNPRKYEISFTIAENIPWSVTIGNQTFLSTESQIVVYLANGSYPYSIHVNNISSNNSSVVYPFPYAGTVVVDGSSVSIRISLVTPVSVSFPSNHYPFSMLVDGVPVTVTNFLPIILPMENLNLDFFPIYPEYGVEYLPFNSSENVSFNFTPNASTNYSFRVYYEPLYLVNLASRNGTSSLIYGNSTFNSPYSLFVPSNSTIRLEANYTNGLMGFQRWVGEGKGSYSGRNQDISLSISGPINETTIYSRLYYLSVKINGSFYGQWAVIVEQRTFHFNGSDGIIPIVNGSFTLRIVPSGYFVASPSVLNVTINGTNMSTYVEFIFNWSSLGNHIMLILLKTPYSVLVGALVIAVVMAAALAFLRKRR